MGTGYHRVHADLLNLRIIRGDDQTVTARLSHQQSIKWIAVVQRKAVNKTHFRLIDHKQLDSRRHALGRKVTVRGIRKLQPAEPYMIETSQNEATLRSVFEVFSISPRTFRDKVVDAPQDAWV